MSNEPRVWNPLEVALVEARSGGLVHFDGDGHAWNYTDNEVAIMLDKINADIGFQHNWLCHPDGEDCEDGCQVAADPIRAEMWKRYA